MTLSRHWPGDFAVMQNNSLFDVLGVVLEV